MIKKIKKILNHEIMRFLIVGGLATVLDYLVMSAVIYLSNASLFEYHFFEVFFGNQNPTTLSVVFGTALGFLSGLIFNYIFSIVFVFKETKKAKTPKGAVAFSLLALMGLGIHILGMYLFYDLLGLNEWVIKIILTIVVLIFNYLTRKFLIFKGEKKLEEKEDKENE